VTEGLPTAPEAAPQHSGLSFVQRKNVHPAVFAIVCLVAVFVLYQIGGGVVTFLFMDGTKLITGNVGLARIATMLGQILLILLPTVLLARLLTRNLTEVFPLRLPSWKESVSATIGLIALQRVFEVYMIFQDKIMLPEFLRKVLEPIRQLMEEVVKTLVHSNSVPEFLYVVVIVAVVPAIAEEFLFRGLVQESFSRAMNPLVSAVVAGTIFGLFHLNPFEAVPLIGIGCFLGVLRYRSKTIILPVLIHFLNNFLAVVAMTMNRGDEKLMLAPHAEQPGLSIILAQLVVFAGLLVVSVKTYWSLTESRERGPA
jgi:membrane protease YdiL (CAAX protease family)